MCNNGKKEIGGQQRGSVQLESFRRELKLASSSMFDLFQDGGDVTRVAAAQAQGRTAEARENCSYAFLRGKYCNSKRLISLINLIERENMNRNLI